MNLLCLRPCKDVVFPQFMLYLLRTREFRAKVLSFTNKAVNQASISSSNLKKIKVSFPPLDEQKRIATILDHADGLRVKRRVALARLDALVQSVFVEMFGDPVTNPMGWEVVKLDRIADIASGVTKGRKLGDRETVNVPYMRVANVQDREINLSEVKTIDVLPEDVKKYLLREGDILLTEGGDPDKLGRGAVWREAISPCIHQNHVFRVRISDNQVLPEYMSALIGSARGKRYFLRAAKQTTGIASINKTQLKAFPALRPSRKLQQRYVETIEKNKLLRFEIAQHLAQLDNLFHALQQRAFRGGLTLRKSE